MIFLYNIGIFVYAVAIRAAAMGGNKKAQQWLEGRKNIFDQMVSALKPGEKRAWFHCASLGEFEQGRPVMEKLKMQNSNLKIVLTFFSPSGYEIRKNYAGADYIFYLPLDTRSNAKKFVALVNPEKVFFVKYEYWHHYFNCLKKQGTPLYLISAILHENQIFFKWYGGFFKKMLKSVTHFFVQDELSEKLLYSIGFKNTSVSGDTRFDRVTTIASTIKENPIVKSFKEKKKLFIAGSSWASDEDIIIQLIESKPKKIEKYIIAPHEISEERIQSLCKKLAAAIGIDQVLLYSKASETNASAATLLIIDNIGMLSSLYSYADVALIGGGFGKSIHNVLEAAVFGMPVFFGPQFKKMKEAIDLTTLGGAFPISNFNELQVKLKVLTDDELKWKKASDVSRNYVSANAGATDKILNFIAK